jgi:hypothetical protein
MSTDIKINPSSFCFIIRRNKFSFLNIFFVDSCLSLCLFFFWSLCCLSFDLRILIISLVSLTSSYIIYHNLAYYTKFRHAEPMTIRYFYKLSNKALPITISYFHKMHGEYTYYMFNYHTIPLQYIKNKTLCYGPFDFYKSSEKNS